jgi:arabinan endo-1,5-alpha-L-arabinosidase
MQVNPRRWLAWLPGLALASGIAGHGTVRAADIEWGNPAAARPPAILQNMGDPTIIKEGNWFYMYGSGSGIPGVRSTNLINWVSVPRVFPNNDTPAWSPITNISVENAGNQIWAPQITKYGSTYRMYYSHSTIGSQRSVIGLATATTLDPSSASYGWTDQGLVLESVVDDPGGYNAIDPMMHVEVAGENGAGTNNVNKNWLMWGSYWSGIFVASLNRNTGKSVGAGKYQIASRGQTNGPGPGIEGPTVVWRNGHYYLFVSYDVYESYNVRVGRSTNLVGPYVDRQGRSMTDGFATPVLAPYGKWRNTGHNDVLLGQSTGHDLFVNHIWTKDFVRALQVRPLFWASDGWPLVGEPITQYPSAAPTALPGSWVHQTGWTNTASITYAGNGTFSTSTGGSGTWQTNSGRLTLNWSGGPTQELALHPDGNSYVGRAADDADIRGWRVPAVPPGANGSYNLASRWQGGVIPGAADVAIVEDDGTLSVSATDPNWSVLDIRIGSSMGSLGAMTQTGSRVTQGGWMRIGINGTGSLDVSGGTNQVAGFITVGENQASSGSLTLRGSGKVSCADLAVGWAHFSSRGEVSLQQGNFEVGAACFIGLEGTGTINMSGGTFNAAGNGWGAFRIGNWPNTNSMGNGVFNLSGGVVNANNTTTVGGFGNGVLNVSGGTWNQNAGNLYVGQKVDASYLGRGEVNQSGGTLNSWHVFLEQGTYNLQGGTLSVAGVGDNATNATGTFNFNGGVLRGTASNANFLSVDTATIQSGGAIFDTQGYDLMTSQPLSGPGGLTKRGTGRLKLSGALAYLGSTRVEAGTLEIRGANFTAVVSPTNLSVSFPAPPPPGDHVILPASLLGSPSVSVSGLGTYQSASFSPLTGLLTVSSTAVSLPWRALSDHAGGAKGGLALPDGRVLLTRTEPSGSGVRVLLSQSPDGGATWTPMSTIVSAGADVDLGDGHLLRTRNGDLFYSYRENRSQGSLASVRSYAIRVARSTNGGTNWAWHSDVASSSAQGLDPSISGGLWSSYLLERSDGTLQCYYDDEWTPYTQGKINHQWVTMETWNPSANVWTNPVTVARAVQSDYLSRDGMVSVIETSPGQLLAVFESVADSAPYPNVLRAVRSTNGGASWSWTNGQSNLLYAARGTNHMALAPWIARQADGRIFCVFATDEDAAQPGIPGGNPAAMDLRLRGMLSADGGLSWSAPAPIDPLDRRAYLPGVLAMPDGSWLASFVDLDANDYVSLGTGLSSATWSGGQTFTPDLLLSYALGGGSSPATATNRPVATYANSILSLSSWVRTNASSSTFEVVAEYSTNLTTWTRAPAGIPLGISGAPDGYERFLYSVPTGNSPSVFMRLRTTP